MVPGAARSYLMASNTADASTAAAAIQIDAAVASTSSVSKYPAAVACFVAGYGGGDAIFTGAAPAHCSVPFESALPAPAAFQFPALALRHCRQTFHNTAVVVDDVGPIFRHPIRIRDSIWNLPSGGRLTPLEDGDCNETTPRSRILSVPNPVLPRLAAVAIN